jgi:hypothetical protein
MRNDSSYEQGTYETGDELGDSFEVGLGGDFEGDFEGESESESETFDTELADFEGEQEQEQEQELGMPRTFMPSTVDMQRHIARHRALLERLRRGVQGVGRHVRKEGNRLRFTLPVKNLAELARRLGIDPRILLALLKSMQRTNQRLAAGRTAGELDPEMDETWGEVGGSCPGESKITTHWWGVAFWLNECQTQGLIKATQAGGAAALACARLIPDPRVKAVCQIAQYVIPIGGQVIGAIDRAGGSKGIVVRKPWITPPGVPPVVIWHQ